MKLQKPTRRSCIPFTHPPIVNSCIMIVHHQNQEINIGIIHRTYSDFTRFTSSYLNVGIIFYNFTVCVALHNHHHMQGEEMFHYHGLPCTTPLFFFIYF